MLNLNILPSFPRTVEVHEILVSFPVRPLPPTPDGEALTAEPNSGDGCCSKGPPGEQEEEDEEEDEKEFEEQTTTGNA